MTRVYNNQGLFHRMKFSSFQIGFNHAIATVKAILALNSDFDPSLLAVIGVLVSSSPFPINFYFPGIDFPVISGWCFVQILHPVHQAVDDISKPEIRNRFPSNADSADMVYKGIRHY